MKCRLFGLCLVFCCLFTSSVYSAEKASCRDILSCYRSGEYKAAAGLLKKHLNQGPNTKQETSDKLTFGFTNDQYAGHLFLAHLYAWRLNDTTAALRILNQARNAKSEAWKQMAPFEILYRAEVYEKSGEGGEAEADYKQFLDAVTDLQEKHKKYDEEVMLLDELARLAKYQLDGLGVPSDKGGKYLKRIKASSMRTTALLPYLAMTATPFPLQIKLLSSGEPHGDLSKTIKQAPQDLGSMILFYAAIVGSAKETVSQVSEKELHAYLEKFPEDYYSLFLRAHFSKRYREKSDLQKAEKLERELKTIAEKRGIEIIVGVDKRFSSPEASWATYKKALKRGDIEDVLECLFRTQVVSRAELKKVDTEEMKKNGENLRDIEKITIDGDRAKYRRRRIKDGKEIIGTEYFTNIDGEWKIGGLVY